MNKKAVTMRRVLVGLASLLAKSAAASCSVTRVGDANVDSLVNVADVVTAVGFVLGNASPTQQQACNADVNGDGAIDVIDVVRIVDIALNPPPPPSPPPPVLDSSWYQTYKPWSDLLAYMDGTSYASKGVAGRSHENRDIPYYQYGDATKPSVLVTCLVHAREWISGMTCPYLAALFSFPESHPILAQYSVYIVPVVNPDGYEHTYAPNGYRYWRKNRRPGGGVDINRNFPARWNACNGVGGCSSGSPSSDTYRGPSAGSEPETRAVMNASAVANASAPLVLYLDIHSYSAVLSGVYSYRSVDDSPIKTQQNAAAPKIVAAMQSVYGYGYEHWTSEDWSYQADGTTCDHFFDTYAQPWSWLFELRPTPGAGLGGFSLPDAQIWPTVREAFAGFRQMCAEANGTKPADYVVVASSSQRRSVSASRLPELPLSKRVCDYATHECGGTER